MKKLLTTVLVALSAMSAQAQIHNGFLFGNNVSLNFSSGAPVQGSSGMNTTEACSAVSSANGTLLFYTNGVRVFKPNNAVMPDFSGSTTYLMSGGVTSTQTLIVPRPGTSTYYVFTVKPGGLEKVKYSVVNPAGGGSVTSLNQAMPAQSVATGNDAEQMTTIRHCNGVDYWLITHEYSTNKYGVYLISNAGISAQGVYAAGTYAPHYTHNNMGYMKASSNGRLIARCFTHMAGNEYRRGIEMVNFNPSNGQISFNIYLIQLVSPAFTTESFYGLEFSPNSEYLYYTVLSDPSTGPGISGVRRVKTSTPYNTGVLASFTSGNPDYCGMQIAPNGTIYIARKNASFISAITNPNSGGTFVNSALTLSGGAVSQMGMPGFAAPTNSACSVASFFFDNQNQTITTVNTLYGPQQAMEVCLPNVYIDGLASSNETAYHLKIEPITLSTWVTGPPLYSGWICTGGCTVPDNFDIAAYATLAAGQYYLVTISVGPEWHSMSLLLRPKNCPNSEASFVFSNNVSQFLSTESSAYGPQDVVNVCGPDVFIDGSASTNENSIYLHIQAFDLDDWLFLDNALYDDWYCINCSGGPNLNLYADVISPASFENDKVYRVAFSVGAQWDSEVRFLRVRNCLRNNAGELNPEAFEIVSPVTVFPNPGSGVFTINTGKMPVLSITIYDMMGNIIREHQPADGTPLSEIDLTGYAAGVYSVKINTGNEVITKRFVKN